MDEHVNSIRKVPSKTGETFHSCNDNPYLEIPLGSDNYFGRGKLWPGTKKLWNCLSENGTVLGLMWEKYYG